MFIILYLITFKYQLTLCNYIIITYLLLSSKYDKILYGDDNMDTFKLCPHFEAAFELLGKRWTGLIIHSLLKGAKRFSDIQDIIPNLSARMLTERFRELEKQGIVVRKGIC